MAIASPPQTVTLHQLLKTMVDKGASDLHITTGSPPQLRIDGDLVPFRVPALGPVETKQLCYSVLTDDQKAHFEEDQELDLSFGVKNLARFPRQRLPAKGSGRGGVSAPSRSRSDRSTIWACRPSSRSCATSRAGLVLITGPTGSGKSTTLAAMIDKINTERHEHIVTMEDPIEFIHQHKSCVVNQREIGSDTKSFKKALRSVLRQDPDVVLVGEMRDLETIEAALTTAETGHLCFGTLHTNSAVQTINRVIDVFPPHQQSQIRAQLSFVLEGVVCQSPDPARVGFRGGWRRWKS